jgi:hypothetical protein
MWKSPFNKVVRSKEALIIGFLAGLVTGATLGGFVVPTVVKTDVYENPLELCGSVDNVELTVFYFHGTLKHVECKDGRKFRL